MNKRITITIITITLMLSGCAGNGLAPELPAIPTEESSVSAEPTAEPVIPAPTPTPEVTAVPVENKTYADYISVRMTDPEYIVNPDFSNIINQSLISGWAPSIREQLLTNYFIVNESYYYEFHEVYESNKYSEIPSFITTDSILHAFHLYYAYAQKETERSYLREALSDMSLSLYRESLNQLNSLMGTEWESAAERNVDYCSIAAVLLGNDINVSERAAEELQSILDAREIKVSPLFSTKDNPVMQDYTQFITRGYYTENEDLVQYFMAMMWFGQMNFSQNDEDLNRSALLLSLAIRDSAKDQWNKIYNTTAFFAGESDDNGYNEYLPIIENSYGTGVSVSDLPGNTQAFTQYTKLTGELEAPQINSIEVFKKSNNANRSRMTKGFRVLGQRFSIDGYIMQKLIYSDVDEANGKKRALPDAMDVPAAMGSEEALRILTNMTDVNNWPDYSENMQKLKEDISSGKDLLWPISISSSWLSALYPLTGACGKDKPAFMRSSAWTDKDLNTFLGSYTELKHDTVLYSKQVMAELGDVGDGWVMAPPDDRGYVEPRPEVYSKLSDIAKEVKTTLQGYGLLRKDVSELTDHFVMIADELMTISEKELRGELPSNEEFDFIRSYGGQLEHLWLTTVDDGEISYYETMEHPASLVTDIATDPENQVCLQLGTGSPDMIYVLVQFDGDIRICRGSVFSFYQFTQPIAERLTDEEWHKMAEFYNDQLPDRPEWISSFFHESEYSSSQSPEWQGYIGKVLILVDGLNCRSEPSTNGEKLGTVLKDYAYYVYESRESEGYTWYRIENNRWIADKGGEWVTFANWH